MCSMVFEQNEQVNTQQMQYSNEWTLPDIAMNQSHSDMEHFQTKDWSYPHHQSFVQWQMCGITSFHAEFLDN